MSPLDYMDVYVVLIKTRQQDTRIGACYPTRAEAEAECERLMVAQGRLEVNETWWVHRQMRVPSRFGTHEDFWGDI